MAPEIGKSQYEAIQDISAQKDLYAAFGELLAELARAVLAIGSRARDQIGIEKGEGLTIERKTPSQKLEESADLEVQRTPVAPKQDDWAEQPRVVPQILYGRGVNNLSDTDIKAISAIIAGKEGKTIAGGENLVIKLNGTPIFETDNQGKISLHTAISPELKAKFADLQAKPVIGKPFEPPSRSVPGAAPALVQADNWAKLEPLVPQIKADPLNLLQPPVKVGDQVESPALRKDSKNTIEGAITYLASIDDGAETRDGKGYNAKDSWYCQNLARDIEADTVIDAYRAEIALDLLQKYRGQLSAGGYTLPAWDDVKDHYHSKEYAIGSKVITSDQETASPSASPAILNDDEWANLDSPIAAPALATAAIQSIDSIINESPPNIAEQKLVKAPAEKPILKKFGDYAKDQAVKARDYVGDRVKKDAKTAETTVNAVSQVASQFGQNFADNLQRGVQSIPDMYGSIKSQLANQINPPDKSLDRFMGQVNGMFDDMKQDDPNLGISASHALKTDPKPTIDEDREKFNALLAKQRERLDATIPLTDQQKILKAAHTMHVRNADYPIPVTPGAYPLPLPTGNKLINDIDEQGINHLSLEKNGERIQLGGIAGGIGQYTPAATLPTALPLLRELKPFLSDDLKLSPTPINAMPLPTKEVKAMTTDTPGEYKVTPKEKPLSITPQEKPAPEPVQKPNIQKGGR